MHTHRATLNADTLITCWSRDDDGRVDQSGATLRAYLYPYGSNVEVETAGIAVTGTSLGKMTFTVTDTYSAANLLPGLYRLTIRNSSSVVVYDGLLGAV
jgi:hypothetical protein